MRLVDRILARLDPPGATAADVPRATGGESTDAVTASPLEPAVQTWLVHELPKLVRDGILTRDQAWRVAHRYGIEAPDGRTDTTETGQRIGSDQGTTAPASPRPQTAPSLVPFLSEHAISIALYLGAFLVVAAVVIYLGYNWGRVGGAAKLGTLLGLTVGFSAAAGVCLARPSVRPAGRTFLALAAVLVPANIWSAWAFVYADGPLPEAAFWLVGALLAATLYAALSVRLESGRYGAASTLALAAAAAALSELLGVGAAWWVPAAQLALAGASAAARLFPERPLARAASVVAAALLPLGAAASAFALSLEDPDRWASSVGLLAMAIGTGLEAIRRDGSWRAGLFGALLPLLVAAVVRSGEDVRLYAATLTLTAWVYLAVARRLQGGPARAWDQAAGGLALVAPLLVAEVAPLAAALAAAAAALFLAMSRARRAPMPLLGALLAIDLSVAKALEAVGAYDSAVLRLSLALFPLTHTWWGAACAVRPRWRTPFAIAALLTGLAASVVAIDEPLLGAIMAMTFAMSALRTARRHPDLLLLVATSGWAMLALHQLGAWRDLDESARLGLAGLAAWPLLASARRGGPPLIRTLVSPDGGRLSERLGRAGLSAGTDWTRATGTLAAGVAGLSALLVLSTLEETDAWLVACALASANLALILGILARAAHSRDLATAAALAFVPGLLAGIARAHPTDAQWYALPAGLYLLLIAHIARRDRRPERRRVASSLAALGSAALLLPSLAQALDGDSGVYAVLAGVEGLALVGWGIATRWRPLVAGGVAGVVSMTLRQLFDAVSALPSWALLGATGVALLGGAVALLLLRDQVRVAGEAVSERWSSWD